MQTMRELEVALGLKGTRKSLVEQYAVLYAEYQRPPLVEVKNGAAENLGNPCLFQRGVRKTPS